MVLKNEFKIGIQAKVEAKVTPDLFAQFEGEVVHPVYSTVSLVYHMEWAARKTILPYLEEDEEGIGGGVTARHLDVSREGDIIEAVATVTEIKPNQVITEVEVWNKDCLVGKGEVTQFILPKNKIAKILTTPKV